MKAPKNTFGHSWLPLAASGLLVVLGAGAQSAPAPSTTVQQPPTTVQQPPTLPQETPSLPVASQNGTANGNSTAASSAMTNGTAIPTTVMLPNGTVVANGSTLPDGAIVLNNGYYRPNTGHGVTADGAANGNAGTTVNVGVNGLSGGGTVLPNGSIVLATGQVLPAGTATYSARIGIAVKGKNSAVKTAAGTTVHGITVKK